MITFYNKKDTPWIGRVLDNMASGSYSQKYECLRYKEFMSCCKFMTGPSLKATTIMIHPNDQNKFVKLIPIVELKFGNQAILLLCEMPSGFTLLLTMSGASIT